MINYAKLADEICTLQTKEFETQEEHDKNVDRRATLSKILKNLCDCFKEEKKHIFSKFPIENFSETERYEFIKKLYLTLDKTNRQIKDTINKINSDFDIDFLYKISGTNTIDNIVSKAFQNEEHEYQMEYKLLKEDIEETRNLTILLNYIENSEELENSNDLKNKNFDNISINSEEEQFKEIRLPNDFLDQKSYIKFIEKVFLREAKICNNLIKKSKNNSVDINLDIFAHYYGNENLYEALKKLVRKFIIDNYIRNNSDWGCDDTFTVDHEHYDELFRKHGKNLTEHYLSSLYIDELLQNKNDNSQILHGVSRINDKISKCAKNFYDKLKTKDIYYYEHLNGYFDLVLDSWLQSITYVIMLNKGIEKEQKCETLKNILADLDKLDNKVSAFYEKNKKFYFKTKSEQMIFKSFDIFVVYLKERSKNLEYIAISNFLCSQIENNKEFFGEVPKEYLTVKGDSVDSLTKKELVDVITEGKKVTDFDEKLETVKKLINIFESYGGRIVNEEYIQDLKVFFREIFMDKENYERSKQAMAIVNEYIEGLIAKNVAVEKFKKNKEYTYICEKISRGFYRETELLSEYILMCKIKEKCMNILLQSFECFDFGLVIENIQKASAEFFSMLISIYKQQYDE